MIACNTLGTLEVLVDGSPAPAKLLWKRNIGLLLYLAYSPKRGRTREHLVGLLWAESTERHARRSLNVAMSDVRRSGGGECFDAESGQVRLAPGAVRLDTDAFDALAAAGDWAGAAALVRGRFLHGFDVPDASAFEDWLRAERLARDRRSVEALLRHGERLLGQGRVGEALTVVEKAREFDPQDAVVRLQMRALALAGDRAGALRVYEEFVGRLRADLDTAPDAETQALAERVRRERVWRHPAATRAGGGGTGGGAESRRAPLSGRGAELGRLLALWGRSRDDRAATLMVILGDPGTGKTRLAEELAGRARLDGAAVITVRAVPSDLTEPGSLVAGLASGGLQDVPGVGGTPAAGLAGLAALLPAWADRFPGAARAANPLPAGPALRAVLRAACEEQPVVLQIEDAHFLDRESLDTLDAALRDLARLPFAVILTAAPQPLNERLDQLRARLGRDLDGAAVSLTALTLDELRDLARWAMPGYAADQLDRLTRRIAADTAGLPLLAVELLHAVSLGLNLPAWPEPLRTYDQSLPGALPDAIVAAVRVGFRRLRPPAQRVLEALAVLGGKGAGRVPARSLQRAVGLDADAFAAALDELEWGRWLTAEGRGYALVARITGRVIDDAEDGLITESRRRRILEAAGEGD